MTQTAKEVSQQVVVSCPNCKAANTLDKCIAQRPVGELIEGGMLCPDCGHWTHSYWMDKELEQRRDRLETIRLLHVRNPTEGRWRGYQTALQAYKRNFETVQAKYAKKGGNTG